MPLIGPLERKAMTIADEVDAIMEGRPDGAISLRKLHDFGLPTGSTAWFLAVEILRDWHGEWFMLCDGVLAITPKDQRRHWTRAKDLEAV